MKICNKCQQTLSTDQFGKNKAKKDGLQNHCKSCRKTYDKKYFETHKVEHRQRTKEQTARTQQYIWDYLLAHPCEHCGETDPVVLEFDHLDRSSKKDAVSRLARNGSMQLVKIEIAKCRVLCANCHRRHTAEQLGWYMALAGQVTETLS